MNQITLLVELQNADTKSDENAPARALLETKLADRSALQSARVELEASEKRAAELKAALRTLELETNGLGDKLKQVSERLYSGRISNAKELAGLNEDEKMLRRHKSELEDRALDLMEQIEVADNTANEKRAALQKSEASAHSRSDKELAALRDLERLDAELARKRTDLRSRLSAETLRIYDDLRQDKKGRAVAIMQNSTCSKCGSQVPSGLIARVKAGQELVFCPNCGRILAP